MALTTEDVSAIAAQWGEWVTDPAFRLSIEVKAGGLDWSVFGPDESPGAIIARTEAALLYCQVEVWRWDAIAPERCLFSERVPHDSAALRASVMVLASAIATELGT